MVCFVWYNSMTALCCQIIFFIMLIFIVIIILFFFFFVYIIVLCVLFFFVGLTVETMSPFTLIISTTFAQSQTYILTSTVSQNIFVLLSVSFYYQDKNKLDFYNARAIHYFSVCDTSPAFFCDQRPLCFKTAYNGIWSAGGIPS